MTLFVCLSSDFTVSAADLTYICPGVMEPREVIDLTGDTVDDLLPPDWEGSNPHLFTQPAIWAQDHRFIPYDPYLERLPVPSPDMPWLEDTPYKGMDPEDEVVKLQNDLVYGRKYGQKYGPPASATPFISGLDFTLPPRPQHLDHFRRAWHDQFNSNAHVRAVQDKWAFLNGLPDEEMWEIFPAHGHVQVPPDYPALLRGYDREFAEYMAGSSNWPSFHRHPWRSSVYPHNYKW